MKGIKVKLFIISCLAISAVLILLLSATAVSMQAENGYAVKWNIFGGAMKIKDGGGYKLYGTIGRPSPGLLTGDGYTLKGVLSLVQDVSPFFIKQLYPGWNTLSVPVKLQEGSDSLASMLEIPDGGTLSGLVDLIYAYDTENGEWVQLDGSAKPGPMDAVYIKLKDGTSTMAKMYPSSELSIGHTKELKQGWNLFGPSLDIGAPGGYKEAVDGYLLGLDGRYSKVISQRLGNQPGWVYLRGREPVRNLYAGNGYWVYLLEDKTLAGMGSTPIETIYQVPEAGMQSLSEGSGSGIPELPAAFFGSVYYENSGLPVQEGTIEVIIDGQVRAAMEFTGGQYGLSLGERLLLKQEYLEQGHSIRFMMNGREVIPMGEIDWSEAGGQLLQLNLAVPLYGDVNGDGVINVGDAILVLRHIVGLTNLETAHGPYALLRSKVSSSTEDVDVVDAILILRHIVAQTGFETLSDPVALLQSLPGPAY